MRAWTECVATTDRSRRNARPKSTSAGAMGSGGGGGAPCCPRFPAPKAAQVSSSPNMLPHVNATDIHRACLSRHEVARTFAACDACREPREHVEHTDDKIRFAHLDGPPKEGRELSELRLGELVMRGCLGIGDVTPRLDCAVLWKGQNRDGRVVGRGVYSGFGWLERGPHVSVRARAELVLLLVLNLFRSSAGAQPHLETLLESSWLTKSERVALNRVENLHLKVLISETFYVLSKDVLRNRASVRKSVHSLDARSFRSAVGGRFLLTKDMKAESLVIATPKFGAWGTRTWRSSAEERGILCAQQNRMRTLEFGARTEGIRDVLLREDGMAKIGIPTEEKHISMVMGSRWGTLFKSTPSTLAKLPFISQLRTGFLHSIEEDKMSEWFELLGLGPDRTPLLVDFNQSSLSLSVLSFRHGLIYTITSVHDPKINGEQIDVKLVKHFAKNSRARQTPLAVCPATDNVDKQNYASHLSTRSARCAVESLKDGIDFTGSINRLRFDTEMRTVYDADLRASIDLLESAGLEPLHVDEMIYVGGGASPPVLDETFFAKDAHLLAEISMEDAHLHDLFKRGTEHAAVHATAKTIGNILPEAESDVEGGLGGQWVTVCDLGESAEKKVGFELWELNEGVKVEKVKPPKSSHMCKSSYPGVLHSTYS
ncbi:hypothetical protein DFH11DRAFT_1543003 [Phellopilus nigrolimitatus]|nr:hypothetical protein DFH11DRAFT_1543003 [Phellopilus nigrolimitatus]